MNVLMLSHIAGLMQSAHKLAHLRSAGRTGACAVSEAALLGKVMMYEQVHVDNVVSNMGFLVYEDDETGTEVGGGMGEISPPQSSTPMHSLVVPIDLEALITRRHRCNSPNILVLSVEAIMNRVHSILSSGYVPAELEHIGTDIISVTHYNSRGTPFSVVSSILGNMRGTHIIFENTDNDNNNDSSMLLLTDAQIERRGTTIKTTFLPKAKGVASIKFPIHLQNYITSISNNFLWKARDLKTLDLAPFSSVTVIGEMFMVDCVALEKLDLSPLSKVTSIGSQFLHSCTSLRKLDLTPLRHSLTTIKMQFLGSCKSLKCVNLTGLEQLQIVPSGFMRECVSLETVDLSPLHNVTNIDYGFLSMCTGLKSLDLSVLAKLSRISEVHLLQNVPEEVVDLTPINHAINYRCIQLGST